MRLIVSCEHATNFIPPDFEYLFADNRDILKTHMAIDLGAKDIALAISKHFDTYSTFATISRLIIDCNRSLTNKSCFSDFTSKLPKVQKIQLLDKYYYPYRQEVENNIRREINNGHCVFHLSVHSFTPVLNQITRNTDFGLLYDPKRASEKKLANIWKKSLLNDKQNFRVRMNYPYRGNSDGFTTALRKKYSDKDYIGIEFEVNQKLILNESELSNKIIESLKLITPVI